VTRRQFLAAGGATLLPAQTGSSKPNLLFILADDLGYGDLSCYGQRQLRTPNIDRIAAGGMRFTQAYAGSTVCAPSRCALMTGLHTGHARIRGNARVPLQPSDVTVAKVLKKAGYRTGLIGKWGLGEPYTAGVPNEQGFDEFYGYLNQQQAHTYYPDSLWHNKSQEMLPGNLGKPHTWSHDLFTARALDFVGKDPGRPWFLYLAYTVPHANNELGRDTGNGMEVPDDAPFSDRPWPQTEKNFAAMLRRLDNDVGKLLDRLKATGQDGNTIVFFTSDNGPHQEGGHNAKFFESSGPLRGIKRDLTEGGIRVPALVEWPGRIQAGAVSGHVWAFWDFLPTAAALAGVPAPAAIDGVSILPALTGKPQKAHDYLYWEFHERGFHQALRLGDWKGIRHGRGAPLELYHLAHDLGERENVAGENPQVAARMATLMQTARVDSPDFPVTEAASSL
jgi:arylsulfatase A-like enzyme